MRTSIASPRLLAATGILCAAASLSACGSSASSSAGSAAGAATSAAASAASNATSAAASVASNATSAAASVASNATSAAASAASNASSAASSAGSSASSAAAGTYTMAQVKTHNSASSCWTVVDGKVYDVTRWITQHPGGQGPITSLCGTDGTSAFTKQHSGDAEPKTRLASFKIGTLAS